jgi:hypothetical protein
MAFRHTLEFIQENGSTFSEIYYTGGTTLAAELQYPVALYNARLAMLANVHTLLRDRVSNTAVARQTGRRSFNTPGTLLVQDPRSPLQLPNVGFPAPPGAAMVINLVGTSGGSRYLWMRGGSTSDYVMDGQDRSYPTGLFRNNLQTFLTQLNMNAWGLLTVVPTGTNKPVPVTKVDGLTNPGQAILTLNGAIAGLAIGSRISLGRFNQKDLPALKGGFTVIAIPPPVGTNQLIQIQYATPGNTVVVPMTGTVRLLQPNPVSTVDPVNSKFAYCGTRIIKNPFSRSRGARRAARIRGLA